MTRRFSLVFAVLTVSMASGMAAQSMRPITAFDYSKWRSIGGGALSNDGKWVVYTISSQIADGELIVRSTTGNTEYRHTIGYVGRNGLGSGGQPQITPDSKRVYFYVAPPFDSAVAVYREKRKPEKAPKHWMAVMNLTDGSVSRVTGIASLSFSSDRGNFMLYRPEKDTTKKAEAKADTAKGAKPAAGPASKAKPKPVGDPLVIRNLANDSEIRLEDVLSHQLVDSGRSLVYIVSTKDGEGDGIYSMQMGGPAHGSIGVIMSGPGRYVGIVFDKTFGKVAFYSDRAEYGKVDNPRMAIYYGDLGRGFISQVVSPDVIGLNMRFSEGGLNFNPSAEYLSFSIAPPPRDTIHEDTVSAKAVFDLWHYRDPMIQPQQLMSSRWGGSGASVSMIYWLDSGTLRRNGNDTTGTFQPSKNLKVALASSTLPYQIEQMWGERKTDLYLGDLTTGSYKLVRRAFVGGQPSLSPEGKYLMLFENNHWYAYNTATGKSVDLTGKLPDITFHNEQDDHPDLPGSYGITGWTKGDRRVLINDRYDIWEFDPTGVEAPRNVTAGVGRKNSIRFRLGYGRGDYMDDGAIRTDKVLRLSADNEATLEQGVWEVQIDSKKEPRQIVMFAKSFREMGKAKNAEMYLATFSTFREFPDLWVGPSLTALTKISDANPQQADFRWGTAQLVYYKNKEGVPLRGILHKPDGFDPKKKYPMVVVIYEKRSQDLHSYDAPGPIGAAEINPAVYVSRGYLVLQPDIVYRIGHPGMSAVSAVTAAVESIIDSGFVDPKRIGLVGHSWGGYQDAFIATKTNLFAAIVSGAPVSNMTSAYGGIRWGSGMNRSFQYERTQSRIGATPWDRPDLYLENSTVFHIKDVKTPLLIQHNDRDGAVPWYQGIELFIALRRMGKEAYFLNYNNEDHSNSEWANVLDWDTRQQEFLDHYLLGAPKPEWMEKGVLAANKGRDQVPVVLRGWPEIDR